MSNTTPAELKGSGWPAIAWAGLWSLLAAHHPAHAQQPKPETSASIASETLTARQQSIVPIAAFAAAGDIAKLNAALNSGLDAGLTVNDAKEVLVQLYAYAGFPRSLNALGELMTVLDARKQRGLQDAVGRGPERAIPKGDALLAAGTANQTRLIGSPVRGALFDFAPAVDEYLKTHLFGDMSERDNPRLQSRELATWACVCAAGRDRVASDMRISMNVSNGGPVVPVIQVRWASGVTQNPLRAREGLAETPGNAARATTAATPLNGSALTTSEKAVKPALGRVK